MENEMTCAKCGSTKIVPRARVIDRGDYNAESGNVRLGVARKPQAIFFKGQEKADIYARLCGACGYAELFVDDAEAIYGAYMESQRDPK
jgi:predicted nucleic-acid-binding Zn-ribbon protein